MSTIQTAAKVPLSKITRAQVEAELEKRNKAIEALNNPQKPVCSVYDQFISFSTIYTVSFLETA